MGEASRAASVDLFSEDAPEVNHLNLRETYEQLRRVHAATRSITSQAMLYEMSDTSDQTSADSVDEDEETGDVRMHLDEVDGQDSKGDENEDVSAGKKQARKELAAVRKAQREALQKVEVVREALWARAMALSRGSVRSLNILHLPQDILCSIFSYFQDPNISSLATRCWVVDPHNDQTKKRRRDIQNARLSCHMFNELASPHLFPYLRVSIDKASLGRFEGISRNPRLRSGVRWVIIDLRYRPREMAVSFPYFKYRRHMELEEVVGECNRYIRFDDYDTDDEETPTHYKTIRQVMIKFQVLEEAWDAYLQPDEEAEIDQELAEVHAGCQLILLRAYEEFKRKHEEQYSLIEEETFANVVAASLARMPKANTVDMEDFVDRFRDVTYAILIMKNLELLENFLAAPYSWNRIEGFSKRQYRSLELLPAKVLSQVPIAMHRAGASIRHLSIGCFPTISNHAMLCPGGKKRLRAPEWGDLRDACQDLESFALGREGMNTAPVRHGRIVGAKRRFVNKFLATMVSGQRLENVDIRLHTLGLNDGKTTKKDYYHIGSALVRIDWPRIKSIGLWYVSLNQDQLDAFCGGLGHSLTQLSLLSVQLRRGSWATALDILRNTLQTRLIQKQCRVTLSRMYGGEFGVEGLKPKPRVGFLEALRTLGSRQREPTLVRRSEEYLLGYEGVEANPLRGITTT